MKTTKKQKFVGYKILVDPETGETYPMQMNVMDCLLYTSPSPRD